MAFFRRSRQDGSDTILPPDIVSKMDAYGRSEFYHTAPVGYSGDIALDIIVPLHGIAQGNPDRFLRELADAVVPVGSWAVFGGARIVWDVLGADTRNPDYFRMMDGALDFLRANGVPPMRLAGYQWDYWMDSRGRTEPWLQTTPPPAQDEVFLAPLAVGDDRCVCRLTDEPDSNEIYVLRQDEVDYIAQVEAPRNDEDPTRIRWDLHRAASLYDLYRLIGEGLGTPPHWYDGDLRRFFPLPQCLL